MSLWEYYTKKWSLTRWNWSLTRWNWSLTFIQNIGISKRASIQSFRWFTPTDSKLVCLFRREKCLRRSMLIFTNEFTRRTCILNWADWATSEVVKDLSLFNWGECWKMKHFVLFQSSELLSCWVSKRKDHFSFQDATLIRGWYEENENNQWEGRIKRQQWLIVTTIFAFAL